jgi:AcrR family transcriptional regulator
MRDDIKTVAEELLVKFGYRGFSFGQISEILGTTRANLHYHFGSKDGLVEEVLEDYADKTLELYREIWTEPTTTLRGKVEGTVALARRRYQRYNPTDDNGEPWSLMNRLRNETDALTPKMRAKLQQVTKEFEAHVRAGVRMAIKSGELAADSPLEKLVIQFVTIIYHAGSVTRDHGHFSRLTDLWEATLSTTERAYATKKVTTRASVKAKARVKA